MTRETQARIANHWDKNTIYIEILHFISPITAS